MNIFEYHEKQNVEEPFLHQLERLGWQVIRSERDDPPEVTLRTDFNSVIIEKEFLESIRQLNPWLEDDQIHDIFNRVVSFPPGINLIDANQQFLDSLLEQVSVSENRQTSQLNPNVKLIDFDNPQNNRFLAASQFKIAIPGSIKHIIPDIVLFVNGMPLGVVECKSPLVSEPMVEGIKQLMRYMCRRGDKTEGNEKLFYYNQILISTFREKAKYSTITGQFEHFIEWKDPYPFSLQEISTDNPGEIPSSQHCLIQGMLSKKNFLDIIYNFTIFQETEINIIKILPRYQQYRAVHKIIHRLETGKTKMEKGGIVWHTQGSGKSLTMLFCARKLKKNPKFSRYKVVFVTNRLQLETQADKLFTSIGYTVANPNNIRELKQSLRQDIGNLVLAMVHKFQEREMNEAFPVLNTSQEIIIFVDEAHTGYFKILGANLERALPKAVKIAFSGTPIEKTEVTFGDYIDKYNMEQSVLDEVTVKIIYEGRTHNAEIIKPEELDSKFADVFANIPSEERRLLFGKYTRQAYLEAKEVIEGKARDMLDHYLKQVFPNEFKAQVVAVSREAAIRYKQAFDLLLKEKISLLEENPDPTINLDTLKSLKVEVVISGSQNDPPNYSPYNQSPHHKNVVQRFLLPFNESKGDLIGDVGIIIVQNMLILGFDAPIEQVMYLDRKITDHNLLQAIARVNRVSKNKFCGFVVDYIGITNNLKEALQNYSDRDIVDIEKIFVKKDTELQNLRFSRNALVEFYNENGIVDIDNNIESAVDILEDEEKRLKYLERFKKFTCDMDIFLPDKRALDFMNDLKLFSVICQLARNRFRDDKFDIGGISEKLRALVDKYLISKGVDPKIPPISIIDKKFATKSQSAKSKAQEIKNAIMEHITLHVEEDPEFYASISSLLEEILRKYKKNWEEQLKAFQPIIDQIRTGRTSHVEGLDPKKEMPFFDILKKELYQDQVIDQEAIAKLANKTKDAVEIIARQSKRVGFWESNDEQRRLRAFLLRNVLDDLTGIKEIIKIKNRVVYRWLEVASYLKERLN